MAADAVSIGGGGRGLESSTKLVGGGGARALLVDEKRQRWCASCVPCMHHQKGRGLVCCRHTRWDHADFHLPVFSFLPLSQQVV